MKTLETLTDELISSGFNSARSSARRRHSMVLHQKGAYHNEVYNFICNDSYMQPHLHPGPEKIEVIRILQGSAAVLFFDDIGKVISSAKIEPSAQHSIVVPAFTWHTYVMLSEEVVTYETMDGVYDPETWKRFAEWAPREGTKEAFTYLQSLRVRP